MVEFTKYMERNRKKNGEKYLPKTITLYQAFIDRYISKFDGMNIDDTIEQMNKLISNYSHANMRAAFRTYLLFLGIDEEDPKLNELKSSKKRASSLNSVRMLGEKVISKKDMKVLYGQLEPEWKLIVGFLYDTACREDEMLQTKWNDIEFFDEDPKDGIYAEVEVTGKGHKKRVVYLTQSTVKLLKQLRPNILPGEKIFVFKMKDGRLYKRQEKALIDGFIKRTKQYLGVAKSPHSMRHSKLTNLADKGADILGISKYAGHSTTKVTEIYLRNASGQGKRVFQDFSEEL